MTKYFKVGIINLVFIEGFIYPLQSFKLNHIEIHILQQDLNIIIVSISSEAHTCYPGIRRLRL